MFSFLNNQFTRGSIFLIFDSIFITVSGQPLPIQQVTMINACFNTFGYPFFIMRSFAGKSNIRKTIFNTSSNCIFKRSITDINVII